MRDYLRMVLIGLGVVTVAMLGLWGIVGLLYLIT